MKSVKLLISGIRRHPLKVAIGVVLLCFVGSFLCLLWTTANGGSPYTKVSKALSAAITFSIAPFIFEAFCLSFWYLWTKMCAARKPWRDLLVLGFSPFITLSMLPVALFSFPGNDTGDPGLIYIAFLISVGLFTYSVYSMVARRYRLLSGLVICVSGPVTVIEAWLSALLLGAPLIK